MIRQNLQDCQTYLVVLRKIFQTEILLTQLQVILCQTKSIAPMWASIVR